MPLEENGRSKSQHDLALQQITLPYSGVKLANRFVKVSLKRERIFCTYYYNNAGRHV